MARTPLCGFQIGAKARRRFVTRPCAMGGPEGPCCKLQRMLQCKVFVVKPLFEGIRFVLWLGGHGELPILT